MHEPPAPVPGEAAVHGRIPRPPPGLRAWRLPHPPRTRGEPAVRRQLGRAWEVAPERIVIARGEHGRPLLQAPHPDWDLGWSHSGDWLLLAAAPGVRLGVDLERLQPRPRAMDLARRFFHPREAAWLQALPEARRDAAFVQLWCAKEAVLKAHGQGISFGLHRLRFEVEAGTGASGASETGPAAAPAGSAAAGPGVGGQPRLVECDDRLGEPGAWQLRAWTPVPGYHAVLAWRTRAD